MFPYAMVQAPWIHGKIFKWSPFSEDRGSLSVATAKKARTDLCIYGFEKAGESLENMMVYKVVPQVVSVQLVYKYYN